MSEPTAPAGPVPVTELRERAEELLARAGEEKERVVLTREGKPFAALVPIDDVEWLEEIEDEIDARLAEEAYREWEAEGGRRCPGRRSGRSSGSSSVGWPIVSSSHLEPSAIAASFLPICFDRSAW